MTSSPSHSAAAWARSIVVAHLVADAIQNGTGELGVDHLIDLLGTVLLIR